MKKLALITAISTLSTPALAASTYSTMMLSGTATDPFASMTNVAAGPLATWYVDQAAGPLSNNSDPAVQLARTGSWTFDFTDPSAVAFTGALYLGDYRVQTKVMVATSVVDGRQTFTGVTQSFAGTGVFDVATRTFTYSFMNYTVNGGGASVYSATTPVNCRDSATSFLGKVCSAYSTASKDWEGLALQFVFADDMSSFTGTVRGTETSGTGITRFTQTINWQIVEPADWTVAQIPVPPAAWLFGSALLGLGASGRRRKN